MKCPKCGSERYYTFPEFVSEKGMVKCVNCGHEEKVATGPAQARTHGRVRAYRGLVK